MIALDTFASQRTFRALLDAMAHPGRIVPLPDEELTAGVPPALLVPLALADLGQGVAVLGADGGPWDEHLRGATSCARADASEAHQVVVLDGATPALITSLRRGTPLAPEDGCRLVLACTSLAGARTDDSADAVRLVLRGPGVAGRVELEVTGLDAAVFVALAEANAGFPAGIDTYLVTPEGRIAGLPRSLTLEVR